MIRFFFQQEKGLFFESKGYLLFQADSCYSKIYLSEKKCKSSTHTLKKWEELLPEHEFIRIHRSFIININHIDEIKSRITARIQFFLTA